MRRWMTVTPRFSSQPAVALETSPSRLPVRLKLLVLPLRLVADRPFDRPEAVEVLDLDDGRRGDFRTPARARQRKVDVHVGIAAQAALLHFAVGNADLAQQQANLLEIRLGLLGAREVGLADDLQQRRAGAVEIDQAVAAAALLVVQHLAGVLFQVDADDADPPGAGGRGDLQPAVVAEGQVVLADLVVLGQVGVVVVLAVPLGERRDRAVEGQGRLEGQVEGAPVHDRQHAGHADADRAGRRVRRQAELRAAAAEQLGAGQQLDVDFQADDDAIVHGVKRNASGRYLTSAGTGFSAGRRQARMNSITTGSTDMRTMPTMTRWKFCLTVSVLPR